jgi:hypothetical protein
MPSIEMLESMTKEELHDYAEKFKERLWRAEAAEHGKNSPQAKSVEEMSIETIKACLLLRPINDRRNS